MGNVAIVIVLGAQDFESGHLGLLAREIRRPLKTNMTFVLWDGILNALIKRGRGFVAQGSGFVSLVQHLALGGF